MQSGFPSCHVARFAAPDRFGRFRRKPDDPSPGVDSVVGVSEDGKVALESLRFDAARWDRESAENWLAETGRKPESFEPAVGVALRLHAPSRRGVLTLATSQPDGIVTKRFRKPLIRTGSFTKAADGIAFTVTPELLRHWELTFRRMQAAGVKVPVPAGHTDDVEANRGWLVGVDVEGDELVGTIDLVGEDAAALAGRSDVSLYIPPELTDGHGNHYRRPIAHVALVTDPVIPGLGDWTALAASASAVTFSMRTKEDAMTFDFAKLGKALGLESLEAGKEEALLLSRAGSVVQERDTAAGRVAELETANRALTEQVTAMEAKVNGAKPIQLSAMALGMAAENRRMKLDKLVDAGKITPAVRDKLLAKHADEAALSLSMQPGARDEFADLCAILEENDPVKLGEQTRAQAVVLSRQGSANPDENPLLADAKRRAERAKK